jgi:L-fuconolactonase
MRIDAHHHFWNYSPAEYGWIDDEKKPLQRDFLPADLKAEIDATDIDGVISVQARQTIEETRALLEHAASNAWIRGVVGWVPLCDPFVDSVLEELSSDAKLRGVRHVVQDEPDDRFMRRDEFVRGIAALKKFDLVYDILVYPNQLPAAIELADQFPNQTFVLDHIAKPRIEADKMDDAWRSDFSRLAERSNVFCKFSGVITEVRGSEWTLETIRPYWSVALECFGASRLMFGTDWPVCLLRGNYSQWVSTVSQLASQLSISEQRAFWGENAITAYNLA